MLLTSKYHPSRKRKEDCHFSQIHTILDVELGHALSEKCAEDEENFEIDLLHYMIAQLSWT